MQSARRLNEELVEDVRQTMEAARTAPSSTPGLAIRTSSSTGSLPEGNSPPLRSPSGRLIPVASIEAHPLWERQRRQNADMNVGGTVAQNNRGGGSESLGTSPNGASSSFSKAQSGEVQANGTTVSAPPAAVLDTAALLKSTLAALESPSEAIKLAALLWLPLLLRQTPGLGKGHEKDGALPTADGGVRLQPLLRVLCDSLGASSAAVAAQALSVLSELARRPEHARDVLLGIVESFQGAAGAKLLQRRGVLIVQTLAERLGALRVLASLSELAASDPDAGGFGASLIQALNLLLLANRSMRPVRDLVSRARSDRQAARVFSLLLRSWMPSCAASLSLALLAGTDTLACGMLRVLASPLVALRVDTMVEACQLVSLLESPAFAALRLRLLDPGENPALRRAVRSLLMLLPQGDAFRTLSTRLAALPHEEPQFSRTSSLGSDKAKEENDEYWIDETALLAEFRKVQESLALKDEAGTQPPSPGSARHSGTYNVT